MKPNASTLPLTVKVVRECATKTLNVQRNRLVKAVAEAFSSWQKEHV